MSQVLLHPQICMAVIFKVGIRNAGLGVTITLDNKFLLMLCF